jgi:hypothetical protein
LKANRQLLMRRADDVGFGLAHQRGELGKARPQLISDMTPGL